tara:strand:- start:5128 stop:5379 length:252 start_codon:yes stop_codon:yes gene_type:complete
MKYVVFCKKTCPFCVKALEVLQEKELPFYSVNFDEDSEILLQEMKTAYDWPTVPMIFLREDEKVIKFIGGYTDLMEWLELGES